MSYTVHTKKTITETEQDLAREFGAWRVKDYEIEFNTQRSRLRNTTLTRAERAVTLRWIPRGRTDEIVLSLDSQQTAADNLRVLFLAVEALRLNERRGIDPAMMRSAYLQLAAPDELGAAYELLGLSPGCSRDEFDAAYLAHAKRMHPDAEGGDSEQMVALNLASTAIRKARGWA